MHTYSIFQSSRQGDPNIVRLSNNIVNSLKQGKLSFLDEFIPDKLSDSNLLAMDYMFHSGSILVPIPRSAPLVDKNALWPAREICRKMINLGFEGQIVELLERKVKVDKAAFQKGADNRPSVQTHYESIGINQKIIIPEGISDVVLVDDIVTQGRTAKACEMRLSDLFGHEVDISLFTMVRSNYMHRIQDVLYPRGGNIKYFYSSGKTFHEFGQAFEIFD